MRCPWAHGRFKIAKGGGLTVSSELSPILKRTNRMKVLSGSDCTFYRQCNPNRSFKNVRIHRNWSSIIDRKCSMHCPTSTLRPCHHSTATASACARRVVSSRCCRTSPQLMPSRRQATARPPCVWSAPFEGSLDTAPGHRDHHVRPPQKLIDVGKVGGQNGRGVRFKAVQPYVPAYRILLAR